MRGVVATVAAAVLFGLAVSNAAALPMRADKLGVTETKWVKPLLALWNQMNLNLHLVQAEERQPGALVPGSGKANKLLTTTLGIFYDCSTYVKQAGSPPTGRLRPFQQAMAAMCSHLGAGAVDVAKAVGVLVKKHDAKAAGALLGAGTGEFKLATTQLSRAQKELMAVGGKGLFVA